MDAVARGLAHDASGGGGGAAGQQQTEEPARAVTDDSTSAVLKRANIEFGHVGHAVPWRR